ncbi:NADH dehydrogenase [ubiquinone] 1 alpha subcomplex subunit 9, mitochondrial-like [Varroa destructor]|uniref:NADH dehydrogenase [ubiquinone] 1 alpha subcomplex subunit 9, mitochondrial n=1 Tax=Varroa destructor TaxID=109461 RepID=A0A7M7MBN6_VARDE|nr:NADH dehydrogenase [ubiquinone] 1 alpha subcomplex subunit 9, mitochondrial-like [Varroa destructor]
MSLCVRTKVFSGTTWIAPLGTLVSRRDKGSGLGTKGDRLEVIRKGTGGRSSFNGVIATVFGNSGTLGPPVVNELGKCGTMMILPYRGDFYRVAPMKICGDLGQILFHSFFLKDEKSVAKAMQYSNVVINMIGKDTETSVFSFKDVHVDGARMIARLARESGVEKLIHFSALNAVENPKRKTVRASKFYASKWEGEQAVREEFPGAIVFRPADIYGHKDRFIRYYGAFYRRYYNCICLWGNGKGVYKAPVFVSDVAQAVVKAVLQKGNEGETYQAVGPKMYELCELVDYIFRVMRRGPDTGYIRFDMRFDPLFLGRILFTQMLLPKHPVLSFERLERENTSDELDKRYRLISDLGIKLTEVEDRFPYELKAWRMHGYADPNMMQFERVRPAPGIPI